MLWIGSRQALADRQWAMADPWPQCCCCSRPGSRGWTSRRPRAAVPVHADWAAWTPCDAGSLPMIRPCLCGGYRQSLPSRRPWRWGGREKRASGSRSALSLQFGRSPGPTYRTEEPNTCSLSGCFVPLLTSLGVAVVVVRLERLNVSVTLDPRLSVSQCVCAS